MTTAADLVHPVFLPVPVFARAIGVSRGHVARLLEAGRLRHVRLGRCVRIPRAELARLLGEADGSAAASSPATASPTT